MPRSHSAYGCSAPRSASWPGHSGSPGPPTRRSACTSSHASSIASLSTVRAVPLVSLPQNAPKLVVLTRTPSPLNQAQGEKSKHELADCRPPQRPPYYGRRRTRWGRVPVRGTGFLGDVQSALSADILTLLDPTRRSNVVELPLLERTDGTRSPAGRRSVPPSVAESCNIGLSA